MAGTAIGLDRTLDGRRRGSLRRLMPGLNGYLVGFAALTGNRTIDEVCEALPEFVRDYELRSRRRFEDRVDERVELRRQDERGAELRAGRLGARPSRSSHGHRRGHPHHSWGGTN